MTLTPNQVVSLLERLFTGRHATSDLIGHLYSMQHVDVVRMCNNAMGVEHIAPHYVRMKGPATVLADLQRSMRLPPGLRVVIRRGLLRFACADNTGVIRAAATERCVAVAAAWSWYLNFGIHAAAVQP